MKIHRNLAIGATAGLLISGTVVTVSVFHFLPLRPVASSDYRRPNGAAKVQPAQLMSDREALASSSKYVEEEEKEQVDPVSSHASDLPEIREPLIEELLAQSGEHPEAVYYMSGVREAIDEGNPAFARELLRQMKEKHSSSILVEEAEALLKR